MYASSTPEPRRARLARRGFALGWVGVILVLLALMAFAMWFVTTTTQANLVHALVGEQYYDLCVSALAESLAEVNEAVHSDEKLQGKSFTSLLGRDFPFKEMEFDPKHTKQIAAKLYPGVTVENVVLRAVDRYPPGEADPLLGVLEMVALAKGSLGGQKAGREVTYRLIFSVPCGVQSMPSPEATYMRIHWGIPKLNPAPVSRLVKRI